MLDVNCPCGSAKKFAMCHGAPGPIIPPADSSWVGGWGQPTPPITTGGNYTANFDPGQWDKPPVVPLPIAVARPAITRKIDLAAGQNPREGFEGVDLWPGSQHVVDLSVYPWPFEDSSVLELHSSHYIEHIMAGYVDASGNPVKGWKEGKDALLAFFDECYRILIPGGLMTVICPCARNNRGFQDPTHRRFIVAETFLYLSAEWRKINKLDHYGVDCNFGVNVVPIVPIELTVIHPDAANRRMQAEWNTVSDWQATLQSQKPAPATP